MKKVSTSMILMVMFLFVTQVLTAQVLISAKNFVAEKKKDKTMVVIDANTAENYAKSHVTGAVNVPHKELYKPGDVEGLIKSPADLAAYFAAQNAADRTAEPTLAELGESIYRGGNRR